MATFKSRGKTYPRKVCAQCWIEQKRERTPESRRMERARAAMREGRVYIGTGRKGARRTIRSFQVMLCMEAHRAYREWARENVPRPNEAERYRDRFASDPEFREREIRRSATRKRAKLLERRGMTEAQWEAYKAAAPERARRRDAAKKSLRERRLRRAMPAWANRREIMAIYLKARSMREAGHDVHVDHDIPINGELVCGLHVEDNLRVIPGPVNLEKGNTFEPFMVMGALA